MKIALTLLYLAIICSNIISQAPLPFEENFENNSLDINIILTPNIDGEDGVIEILDGYGVEFSRGLRIGKLGDNSGLTTNALDINIDLSDEDEVEMSFWIYNNFDNNDPEDGIYFSDDGGDTFVQVVNFKPEEYCGGQYLKYPPIDISRLAADAGLEMVSEFVIRFLQKGSHDFIGGASNQDGFYFDNIKVYNPGIEYTSLPMEDDFETGILQSWWAQNDADKTSSSQNGEMINSPTNIIDVKEPFGVGGSYGVRLGKICSGVITSNALDLHLNLIDETNVELRFMLLNNFNANYEENGVFFSNDAGNNFVKIYDFDFTSIIAGEYIEISMNISNLVSEQYLELSEKSIIRFQQKGEHDFTGGASNQEGYFLDNIFVNSVTTSNVSIASDLMIKTYPNPTMDKLFLNVASNSVEGISKTSLTSMSGEHFDIRMNRIYNNISFDIADLSSGIYILLIVFENGYNFSEAIMVLKE